MYRKRTRNVYVKKIKFSFGVRLTKFKIIGQKVLSETE